MWGDQKAWAFATQLSQNDSSYDRLHNYIQKEKGNPYKYDLLRACAGKRNNSDGEESTSQISHQDSISSSLHRYLIKQTATNQKPDAAEEEKLDTQNQ